MMMLIVITQLIGIFTIVTHIGCDERVSMIAIMRFLCVDLIVMLSSMSLMLSTICCVALFHVVGIIVEDEIDVIRLPEYDQG